MKNNIILWISAFVIVFVLSYLKSIYSENYPITGTIGVDGQKLSYKLDKEGFGKNHKLLINSDNPDINASAIVIKNKDTIQLPFNKEGVFLSCELDRRITDKNFNYHLLINSKSNNYRVPNNDDINFVFWGKISRMLSFLYNLFLFTGMILIARSGLEYFNNNFLTKKLLVLAGVVWMTFIMLINPLYLSYKFEYINHIITPIQSLFPTEYLSIFMLLIITTILTFNKKFTDKPVSLVFSIVGLILYMI